MKSLSQPEQSLIKRMIDELIISAGILDLKKLHISEFNIDIDRLTRIACEYYRIIREGQITLDFADIARYIHVVGEMPHGEMPRRICLSCGSGESITATKESSFIPLCDQCHEKLDVDITMMASLLS